MQTENGKINTQLNILSQDSLKNGESIQVELKDIQGKPIAGQSVTITYEENGQNQNYTVLTDNQGQAFLTLNGESAGQHNIKVNYAGNDKYNGCTAEKTITIVDGQATASTTTTANQSTASTLKYNNKQTTNNGQSNQIYYDKELNTYYDSNGKIVYGQNKGSSIYDVRFNYENMDTSSGDSE